MGQPVLGPDGKMYQFPDGTTKEQAIAYFKRRNIGAKKFETTAADEALFGSGRAIAGAAKFPFQLAAETFPGMLKGQNAGPADVMVREFAGGLRAGKKARDLAKTQGEGLAGQTLATLENYPLVGPMVRYAESGGPKMFNKKSIGAASEAATMAVLPELLRRKGLEYSSKVKGTAPVSEPAKAGPLIGARTRAIDTFQRLEKAFGDIPVNHEAALQWANKAVELGKKGFAVPKPVTDFINFVESKQKTSLTKAPGGMIDTPGSMTPLTLKDARQFSTATREAIPWEQYGGKRGEMFSLTKKMRTALENDTTEALRPYGADRMYIRAKADFRKAMSAHRAAGPIGWAGGKIAGYGFGYPHPIMAGYVGGQVGEGLAGSMVRSVIEAGGKK